MLPVNAPPDANFLDQVIAQYVEQRIPMVLSVGGTLDPKPIRRNMLPLCFNLFGFLRTHLDVATRVLNSMLALEMAEITRIEVERALPPAQHLGDRIAFDAFIECCRADEACGFVGVEKKYTEPFSPDPKLPSLDTYRAHTAALTDTFKPGAAESLEKPATSQIWRNALLALSLRDRAASADDKTAVKAIQGLCAELCEPDTLVRTTSFEALLKACEEEVSLAAWASRFCTRYLDLIHSTGHSM